MSDKKGFVEVLKSFPISNFALKNKISVYVLIFLILIAGVMSYSDMPKESFPEIVQPIIYVGTAHPGNSPVDMENLVTRPIEKELKSLKGLKKFSSVSIQDFSTVIVEFEFDVDPAEALLDVKDAVDKAKPDLPSNLPADPNVFELNFSDMPVMNVNIFGDFSKQEMKEHAEFLQEEIEALPEVSAADIVGLLDEEVKVNVDLYQMQAQKLAFSDIENAIRAANVSMGGGDILAIEGSERTRRSIRIDGEFQHYSELENVIVKNKDQKVVYLRDIADVEFSGMEPTSFARLDGQMSVTLDIKKKSGENLLKAAAGVQKILEEAKATRFPENLNVVVTNDQSKQTKDMVNNLENSIISGVILVVLVLMFFLGLRNATFVGIAIPLSMLMGIAFLNYTGNTLNMMVLFSLILALGLLVDNGIVVVENIYRLVSEGHEREWASKYGIGEVAMPIIASTITTLMAFLPLLFWQDLMGEFMKFLPITLIIVLSCSLFVAIVVNPVLASRFMKVDKEGHEWSARRFWIVTAVFLVLGLLGLGSVFGGLMLCGALICLLHRFILKPFGDFFQKRILVRMENAYERVVNFAVYNFWRRIMFFWGAVVMMMVAAAVFAFSNPNIVFFPDNQPNVVHAFIEMPLGTDIETTNEFTKEVERRVKDAIAPNRNIVEAVLAKVGEGTADPNAGPQQGSSPHKARVSVSFYEYARRIDSSSVATASVMSDIERALSDMPAGEIVIAKDASGPPTGKPINVEVSGSNFVETKKMADKVKAFMESLDIPGVDQLKMDLEPNKPEMVVSVHRDVAKRFGVSTMIVADAIRTALYGKEVSTYKEGEDDYPIYVRLKDEYRYNEDVLLNQKITFNSNGNMVQVPIRSIATVEKGNSLGSVRRLDGDRVITVFSEVKQGYNADQIVSQFKKSFYKLEVPPGLTVKFTGQAEEQAASMQFLMKAMFIAVLLIFLILVSQFNSVIAPAIILFSVVMSITGVLFGFGIFGMDFSIMMCMIGLISLAGVVVNNAIVLIDYANLLRARKRAELGLSEKDILPVEAVVETIIEAGKTRFKPVILTAITTVLGLVPLALGVNINFNGLITRFDADFYVGGDTAIFWGPMAWTIIFGLIFATFLTLVVVPVMYLFADRMNNTFRNLFKFLGDSQ